MFLCIPIICGPRSSVLCAFPTLILRSTAQQGWEHANDDSIKLQPVGGPGGGAGGGGGGGNGYGVGYSAPAGHEQSKRGYDVGYSAQGGQGAATT
ncbi:hypothetical protein JCM3766R1_001746 [Sporobolomyces carnicolor]